MRLADHELIRRIYDVTSKFEDGEPYQELMHLLEEAFERWVPLAAWKAAATQMRDDGVADELHDTRHAVAERMAERMKLAAGGDELSL